MYTFARCSGSRTRLRCQSFQTQKRLCLCPPTERQVFLYRVIFLPSAMRPRYSKYGGLLAPWFCFPWFQLPVGNCGLKILNGKMSEMNNSSVPSCPPASSAMTSRVVSRCLALSCPRLCPVSPHCRSPPGVTRQPSGLSERLSPYRSAVLS